MYTYIRGSPHIIVRLFMVSTYEFSASQGVPKERWFSGRTDETCRRRKKRVSQFLNLVNLPISLLLATACMQGFVKSGTPKSLKLCYFQSRNYRFTGAPTLILYYICRVLRQSFVEIIPLHCQKPDTHRISCSGFRSVTDSIQNWVSFAFLMVRCNCYLFL